MNPAILAAAIPALGAAIYGVFLIRHVTGRNCTHCRRRYHPSWEEPKPGNGEEDLRGLCPSCTGAI